MTYEIIPGILEESQSEMQKKFDTASRFARTVQIDVIDFDFASRTINPDLTFTTKYKTPLEIHLMTKSPEDWVESFKNLNIKRIIGHVELMQNIPKFIDLAKFLGAEPFLGIDLPTDIKPYASDEYIKKGAKGFLIMTVKAGMSGQEFNQASLRKVELLRVKFKDKIDIEIDGGVNKSIIKDALNAGTNLFAATSAIFTQHPEKSFQELSGLLDKK